VSGILGRIADSRSELTRTTPALVQLLAQADAARLSVTLAEQGLDGLRPAHALLLVPLLGGGRHASDLADRLRVSRQAVAQVAATLERGGYVERVADPGDARAKLICLTARGRAALRAMRAGAQELERDWEARLGAARLAEFREILAALLGDGGLPAGMGREKPPDDLGGVECGGRRVGVE
jgi:DNA-binding MarR family transcriptional regulator